jgi:hypothetical protein
MRLRSAIDVWSLPQLQKSRAVRYSSNAPTLPSKLTCLAWREIMVLGFPTATPFRQNPQVECEEAGFVSTAEHGSSAHL